MSSTKAKFLCPVCRNADPSEYGVIDGESVCTDCLQNLSCRLCQMSTKTFFSEIRSFQFTHPTFKFIEDYFSRAPLLLKSFAKAYKDDDNYDFFNLIKVTSVQPQLKTDKWEKVERDLLCKCKRDGSY
jgi:hypothetical protein